MALARFVRDAVDAVIVGACETMKDRLRADFGARFEAIRAELRSDVERTVLFAVLFRTQADQARRLDAVDAILGVFLTALLAVGPLALEKAPTTTDRWIAAIGFGSLVVVVGLALFLVGGRELKADIALQIAADLRSPDGGSREAIREAVNDLRRDPFAEIPQDVASRRGAAGFLAQLIAQDRLALWIKRRLLLGVAIATLALACTIGYRDVVQSPSEGTHDDSGVSRQTSTRNIRRIAPRSGEW